MERKVYLFLVWSAEKFITIFGACPVAWRLGWNSDVAYCCWCNNQIFMFLECKFNREDVDDEESSTFGLTTLPECGQFEDEAIRMRVRRRAETGEWSGPWIHMSLICITYSRRRGIIFGGVAPSGGCSVAEIWNLIHCPPLLAGGNYSLEHVRHRDRSSQLNLIEFIRLWLSDIAFVTLFINSTPTPISLDGQCWSVSSSVEMRWHIMEWRMD